MNRLSSQLSPYLRQHQHHPVHWYPWGPEALAQAQALDRPIFLSIGYAACHWCHIMAHECFEDAEVADVLNRSFISIKVDREERSDLDALYMSACQLMNQRGGWPLTAVLTSDLKPFFAGTYFPKHPTRGMPGLLDLLHQLDRIWQHRRDEAHESADSIVAALAEAETPDEDAAWDDGCLERAQLAHLQQFDSKYGGYGSAPKFLVPHTPMLMMHEAETGAQPQARESALFTLKSMSRRGVFDQLGGGFHRYATDRAWRIPHFEKMLYDQAMMVVALCRAHTADPRGGFDRVVHQTVDFVFRELMAPDGTFYSSLDADSEGEEGRYYTWTHAELQDALGHREAELAIRIWGLHGREMDLTGGRYVLESPTDPAALAAELGMGLKELEGRLEGQRKVLFDARAGRIRPGLDDKVLTDWNGLMIGALALAGRLMGVSRWVEAAVAAEDALWRRRVVAGHLTHTETSPGEAIPALLDDYAFLISCEMQILESVGLDRYLVRARDLMEQCRKEFWDARSGGFFAAGQHVSDVLVRQRPLYDGALPSGNSMQLLNLRSLFSKTADSDYLLALQKMKSVYSTQVSTSPWAFSWFVAAAHVG